MLCPFIRDDSVFPSLESVVDYINCGHCFVTFSTVHNISLNFVVQFFVSRWCVVVYCGVLWFFVVYCGVLWCIVVYCGVLWCVVVYSGVLWCIVVYCGVLWCIVLVYCG